MRLYKIKTSSKPIAASTVPNKRKAKLIAKSEEPIEMLSAQELLSIGTAIQNYKRKLAETDWNALGLPEVDDFRRRFA